MVMAKRHNYKWNNNEVNSLFREYELLELTPEEISEKHQRTVQSILFRLQQEGLIDDEARNGWKFNACSKGNNWIQMSAECDDSDDDDDANDNSSLYEESECENEFSDEESEINDEDGDKFKIEINGRVTKLEEHLFDMKTMISHILKKVTNSSKSHYL